MINKKGIKSIFIFLLALIAGLIFASASHAVDSYTVNSGATLEITEHGACRAVTNNHASSLDLMVPTKTCPEWKSFVESIPQGASAESCLTGPILIDPNLNQCSNNSSDAFSLAGSQALANAPDDSKSIWVRGNTVFTAAFGGAVAAYNFDGSTFTAAGTVATTTARDIWANEDYVFIADSAAGLHAYSHNGTSFSLITTYNSAGTAYGVWGNDSHIFLADGTGGVRKLTFNGTAFSLVTTIATGNTSRSIMGNDTYLFVEKAANGIFAYDINTGAAAGSVDPGYVNDIWVDGQYVYVADSGLSKGFIVYSHSGSTFIEIDNYLDSGQNQGVWSDGKLIYTSDYPGGYISAFSFNGTALTLVDSIYVGGLEGPVDIIGNGQHIFTTEMDIWGGTDAFTLKAFTGLGCLSIESENVTYDYSSSSEQQIMPAVVGDYYGFGGAIAIDGETAVIGATGAAGGGRAYVYVKSGGSWVEQQTLAGSDTVDGDGFGGSVAIDGDTIIVSAEFKNSQTGAAYVFTRSGSTWTQQQKLTASDASSYSGFAGSVSISGDSVIVGAYSRDAAYIYTRSGSTWTQQQKITGTDTVSGDRFGAEVAIDGDTVLVGSIWDDDVGSGYFFTRSGSTWTQQDKVVPSDGVANDIFGGALSLSGDTAVLTAFEQAGGAAYIYTRSGSDWTQIQKIRGSQTGSSSRFGFHADMEGDVIIIGDYYWQQAYIFKDNAGTWEEIEYMEGPVPDQRFGWGVGISEGTFIIGNTYFGTTYESSGIAHVFTASTGSAPPPLEEIFCSAVIAQAGNAPEFGSHGLAIEGGRVVVGVGTDDNTYSNDGSVYVFDRSDNDFPLTQKIVASNASSTSDYFGWNIDLEGDTLIVSAPWRTVGGFNGSGAVYVYYFNGTSWVEQAAINNPAPEEYGFFGKSIDVDGDNLIIGAGGNNGDKGSVYIYTRSGSTWSQQALLNASDGATYDYFGSASAIDGDTAVIGAPGDNASGGGHSSAPGSIYIFTRSGSTWTQSTKIFNPYGNGNTSFGAQVDIKNGTIAASAPSVHFTSPGGSWQGPDVNGRVAIYTGSGTSWALQTTLVHPDNDGTLDYFGGSDMNGVTLFDNAIAIMATPSTTYFTRTGSTWDSGGIILTPGYSYAFDGELIVHANGSWDGVTVRRPD